MKHSTFFRGIVFLILLMAATDSRAQTLQLTLTPSNYNSKCYSNGCDHTGPYSYRWSRMENEIRATVTGSIKM